MIFFEDTLSERQRIEEAIKKYGYASEHNFWWYQCQANKESKNIFAEYEDGTGLLTIKKKDKYIIFSSPLAPESRRVPVIIEYLNCVFQSQKIKKVTFEIENELYKKLIKALPATLKARKINYSLTCPVYNLENFEPDLPGNRWKTLRKEKNKFYRNHSVLISDAKTYKDKGALHYIINEWRKKRSGHDRTHLSPYHNFINENFKGSTEARILIVDEKTCGINAGWMIPNSNRFYGSLGIHDYSISGLGDILYLEDLTWLKTKGYKEADMGGGETALTNFKNKFRPESFYRTYIFSVVKQ